MKILTNNKGQLRILTPLFCSIGVLIAGQAVANTPSVSLNADEKRGNIAESGHLGYVGGSTRVGVSIDKNLQGQVDINQVISNDGTSATSAEGWFGYQIKDKNGSTKGVKGGGVKLNHLWVNAEKETVHKAFGAYDKDADDHAKVTAGYGQEKRDIFWSGHLSKGISEQQKGTSGKATKAYDYGVGGEVGTFIEDSLTRVRGAVDYEWGTDQAKNEDTPTQATISAGVQQYFYDSPHSVTVDVSASKKSGGATHTDGTTSSNARLGYQYEFGKNGTFQSDQTVQRTRVEIAGTPAIAATPAIPAVAGMAAQYTKKAIRKPYTKLVKTTMKLENETFFKLNRSTLTASAKENLLKIAAEIRKNRYTGSIRITGNTCGLGDAAYDQRLSERRAKTVRQFLISEGFNATHLIARGLGKNHPKYRNNPETGFKNRRVDIEYVTEHSTKKKRYKTEYKNVLVSAATSGTIGQAGYDGKPATPARFIWKTEEIKTVPLWIKRALHNPIHHKRSVDTYQTQTAAPTAPVDDYYTLNSPYGEFDVLENDGDGLTLTNITVKPSHGTAVILNGKIKYTVDANYTGVDQLTYEVKDIYDNTQTAVVTITIPDLNLAPIAVDDKLTTTSNTAIIKDIISNDTDPENDTLTLLSVSAPSFGTIITNGNEITYTPDNDFIGTDTFTYVVSDGKNNTSTGTVTIDVTSAKNNIAPNAIDDVFNTRINTAKTYDVIANDNDNDGDTLVISSKTDGTHGSVEIVNGQTKYTPDTDYTGTDTFTYTVSDGKGGTDTATVNVTIEANNTTNKAPDAIDDAFTVYVNTSKRYDVINNDHDDDGDTLTLSEKTEGQHGTVKIINNQIEYSPATDYIGTDSFTYTISDGKGHSATATVNVTIETVIGNVAPVAVNDAIETDVNTAITYDVLANDSDADGDNLIISAHSSPQHGVAATVNNKMVYTPETNYTGTDSFEYSISDNHGHTATAQVTVKIGADSLVLSPNYAATYGNIPVSIRVLDDDIDPEGDTLSLVSISTLPQHGTATIVGDEVSYQATTGYVGKDSFRYQATDNNGHTSEAEVSIDVKQPTTKHVGASDIYMQAEIGGSAVTYDVSAEISDIDNHALTASILLQPSNGTANVSGNIITFTPNGNYSGSDTFDYKVCDLNNSCDTATVFVSNTNQSNSTPVLSTITPFSANTGITTGLDISAFVSDADGDSVYLSAADALSGSVTFNNLVIQYTPIEASSGSSDSINIEIRDGNGGIATSTITVTIN
jgi:outer membrane protein OmpA-like peptidoglycan-associated protein